MRRKSKREIERAVEGLECKKGGVLHDGELILYRDPETGTLYDRPISDEDATAVDECEADPLVILTESLVETDWEAES